MANYEQVQPQYPSQYPPQMQQPQYPPQPQYQSQYPQPQYPPQPQMPTPGALPAYHLPDESQIQAAYEQSRAEVNARGGNGANYLKFPGPAGQIKWGADVYVGFESKVLIYILPSWAAGKNFFKQINSHFWKGAHAPGGTSIGCPGPGTCLVCQARDYAYQIGDDFLKERAKNFGRVRHQYLYQVAHMEQPQLHMGRDNTFRPLILGASTSLHNLIGDVIDDKKTINVIDPIHGRPLRIKKKKTGIQNLDIEYGVIPQDPFPLPPMFYPLLQAMHDLDAFDKAPTQEEMLKAVQGIGLPLPGGFAGAIMVPGWSAGPSAPPYPNPYQPAAPAFPQSSFQPPPSFQPSPSFQPPPPFQPPAAFQPPASVQSSPVLPEIPEFASIPPPVSSGTPSQFQGFSAGTLGMPPPVVSAPPAASVPPALGPPLAAPAPPNASMSAAVLPPPPPPVTAPPGVAVAAAAMSLDQLQRQLMGQG